MIRRITPLAVIALLLGCGSEVEAIGPESPDEVVIVATASTQRPSPEVAIVRGDPPSPLDAWTLPRKAGPTLGSACPQAAPAPQAAEASAPVEICGSRQRVALELQDTALDGVPPCELHSVDGDAFRGMYRATGCVDGDHLVLSNVCLMCRSPNVGVAVHARLSELTPAQHAHLGKLMGFKPTGPATPAAWRALVAKGTREKPPREYAP